MRHLDLFSGIGGFALAADRVFGEVEHIFCDIEPFPRAVLKKHWPKSKIYEDIRDIRSNELGSIDIITGGFPCQPFSSAGKRLGTEDERNLWPEMLRIIREVSPHWVVGENVRGLTNWNAGVVFDQVQLDLETSGYEVLPFLLPACGVNAPHRRDRIWFIAHAPDSRNSRGAGEISGKNGGSKREHVSKLLNADNKDIRAVANPNSECHGIQGRPLDWAQGKEEARNEQLAGFLQFNLKTALSIAGTYRTSHGIPSWLDVRRNIALGNSIVPQVAEQIMRAINATSI